MMGNLLNLSGLPLFTTMIFMLTCGIFECFMGYKIVRGIMLGTGLCAGFSFGWNLCAIIISQIEISKGFDFMFQITISIMCALIFSMLAYRFHRTAMFLTCGFSVFILLYSMLGLLGIPSVISIILGVASGIGIGGLTVKFFRYFTIVSSAIFGGILVGLAIYMFSKNRYGDLINIIPGFGCAVAGLIVQLRKYGRKHTENKSN